MVKQTQTIRWEIPDELFERVWPFCGIGASRVNTKFRWMRSHRPQWNSPIRLKRLEKNISIIIQYIKRILSTYRGIYLFKVNYVITRKMGEICSDLTIKTSEWRQWLRSCVFIGNFKHISHIALVFQLLTLNK